jgi:hypothetical protein
MLNTTPHTVTRGVDSEAITLVFYPDTGCLRFADSRGVCHELRPPHSWLALAWASRGVRSGAQAVLDGLNVLLYDFCMQRPQWMCGPAHAQPYQAVQALGHARTLACNSAAAVPDSAVNCAYLPTPSARRAPFDENIAVTQ